MIHCNGAVRSNKNIQLHLYVCYIVIFDFRVHNKVRKCKRYIPEKQIMEGKSRACWYTSKYAKIESLNLKVST